MRKHCRRSLQSHQSHHQNKESLPVPVRMNKYRRLGKHSQPLCCVLEANKSGLPNHAKMNKYHMLGKLNQQFPRRRLSIFDIKNSVYLGQFFSIYSFFSSSYRLLFRFLSFYPGAILRYNVKNREHRGRSISDLRKQTRIDCKLGHLI